MPTPKGFLHETPPGRPAESWMEAVTPPAPERPRLTEEISVDVAVVGAGYAGLSAALTLAERGVRVAVVEAHVVGWGASGRNGGQLDTLPRREAAFFEAAVGFDDARKVVALAQDAAALVRRRIATHGIDCALTNGLVEAHHSADLDLEAEAETTRLRARYGAEELSYLPPARLRDWVRAEGYSGGVLNRAGGSLNPLAFARGLAAAAETAGARIFERSRVTRLDAGQVSWADPGGVHQQMRARLETAEGAVSADRVLLCLGGYHDRLEPSYAARVTPLRAFQVATEPLGARLAEILPGGAAVSDTRFVVNYFRPTPDGRLLFGGGETSRMRDPRDIARIVQGRMLKLFPTLAEARIDYAWGGTLGVSRRRAPVFLRPARRVIAIGGWSGAGVHMAALGGEVAAEAILGDPARFDLLAKVPAPAFPAGGRLRRPMLAAALAWHGLKDRRGG